MLAEQTARLFLYSVLPIVLMFCAERWLIFYLRQTDKRKAFVRSSKALHPNTISRFRYFAGAASVLLYLYVSQEWAILFFSFWMISDVTDGSIAKYFDLATEEGKVIDPLSDKLLYFPPLFFVSYLGLLSWSLVAVFFAIDLVGQLSRYFIADKSANLFGKAKTFVAVITLSLPTLQHTYYGSQVLNLGDTLLSATIFLAFLSLLSKTVPNIWYANILSMLNLVCGLLGIIVVVLGYNPMYALILIFIGQFLDLFDGRAAEKWGSTPRGEVFDDLADGTSFGLAIAIIVFFSVDSTLLGVPLALFYLCCAVYRLMRFLKDKAEAGVASGVFVFKGMPTPGAALLTGGGALVISHYKTDLLFLSPDMQLAIVSIASSLLMVSHIPYVHFGRVVLAKIPRMIKVMFCGIFVALMGFTIQKPDEIHLAVFVFVAALVYLFLGISRSQKQM